MHMSDALVSVAVGTTMAAVSTGFMGFSVKKVKSTGLSDHKIPMMGVMGAFVFAAQMINFTIPVTGSSGHIGGGVLLAALLGPYPAFLTLASVLFIQALFFADGGLLALGCNIFNMGFFSCILAYPLIYRPILKRVITPKRIMIASILSVIVSLQLGSFMVVLETTVSGVTELPFMSFLVLMQPIHLAIGIIEGIATGAVLNFVYRTRKEILHNTLEENNNKILTKQVFIIFMIATVIIGGFLSIYASAKPDGLEWSIQKLVGDIELNNVTKTHETAQTIQDQTAVLPDYSWKTDNQNNQIGTSISGIVGAIITMSVTIIAGMIFLRIRSRKQKK